MALIASQSAHEHAVASTSTSETSDPPSHPHAVASISKPQSCPSYAAESSRVQGLRDYGGKGIKGLDKRLDRVGLLRLPFQVNLNLSPNPNPNSSPSCRLPFQAIPNPNPGRNPSRNCNGRQVLQASVVDPNPNPNRKAHPFGRSLVNVLLLHYYELKDFQTVGMICAVLNMLPGNILAETCVSTTCSGVQAFYAEV